MTRDEMLAELKVALGETSIDPAWGDARLLDMMAEGQDQFCEDTGYFVDQSTSTICEFTSVIGQASYTFSDRIIHILEVWQDTTRLGKFNQTDKGPQNRLGVATEVPANNQTPYAWQTDRETQKVTIYPTPIAALDYTLRVWRYATTWLADTGAEPEIPVRFHRAPIMWAAFLALSDHDFEKQDDVKAKEHLAMYQYYVGKGTTAFNRLRGGDTDSEPAFEYVVDS